jgi:hypothetical protein
VRLFQKSEATAARRDLFVQMVDAGDFVTPMTGLSLVVKIAKAGGSTYGAIAGSVSEVTDGGEGTGTYRVALGASDLDTEGEATVKVTASGAATQFVPIEVVRFPDEVHLVKAALANARVHTIDTGVDEIKDDDGQTTLRTLTPSETNGVVTVAVS